MNDYKITKDLNILKIEKNEYRDPTFTLKCKCNQKLILEATIATDRSICEYIEFITIHCSNCNIQHTIGIAIN